MDSDFKLAKQVSDQMWRFPAEAHLIRGPRDFERLMHVFFFFKSRPNLATVMLMMMMVLAGPPALALAVGPECLQLVF